MAQWIKKYFELHYSGQDYDPVQRRNGQDLHYILGTGDRNKVMPTTGKPMAKAQPRTSAPKVATSAAPGKFSSAAGGAGKAEITRLEGVVADLQTNNEVLDKEH